MSIVGHVVHTRIYTFEDGVFSFHTAFNGSGMESTAITFRSPMTVWPSITAADRRIEYKLLLGATTHEIERWLDENPEHKVIKVSKV